MASCLPLRRRGSKSGRSKKDSLGCTDHQGGSNLNDSPPEREVTEGQFAAIYSQHFVLGVSTADTICIPLHLRLRQDIPKTRWGLAKRRKEGIKRGGWVIWFDEDTRRLSATTVAQWTHSSRSKWLEDSKTRCNKRCDNKDEAGGPSRSSPGAERRVLHLFVLLHGMSPPALLQTDVVENFGNLIATVLERFPPGSPACPHPDAHTGNTENPSTPAPCSSPAASHTLSQQSGVSPAAAPTGSSAPSSAEGAAPISLLFVIYSYRAATWQSVAACMSRIVPLLAAELGVLLENWDEVRLFAVGHSLGGLLWRFMLLRRLQQLLYRDGGKGERGGSKGAPPECYNNLLMCFQHPNLHLKTFCTLASPHVGAYKSSAVYRSMPKAVAGLRFLPNSDYAQELLLKKDKGFLAALAAEEHAGRSHLTFPFPRAQQDAKSSNVPRRASYASGSVASRPLSLEKMKRKLSLTQPLSETKDTETVQNINATLAEEGIAPEDRPAVMALVETPQTHRFPGEVAVLALNRFENVILYGILETDWIVSANSALATAINLRRTPEGKLAMQNPMYPIHLKSVISQSGNEASCAWNEASSSKSSRSSYNHAKQSIELMLAQQHIDVFNHVSHIDRFIVYIRQNPLFLAPHATLKGSPCIVTPAEQKKTRKEAAPILEHVTAHLLNIEQQHGSRPIYRTPSAVSKPPEDTLTTTLATHTTEPDRASIGTDLVAPASVHTAVIVAGNG